MSGEIKLSNITKIFNPGAAEEVTALNGVDFTIPAGSFVSLIGPSGCGKTTLLRCIAGLETPTSGEVSVDGSKITKPGSDRGFAFQQANLFPGSQSETIFPLASVPVTFIKTARLT